MAMEFLLPLPGRSAASRPLLPGKVKTGLLVCMAIMQLWLGGCGRQEETPPPPEVVRPVKMMTVGGLLATKAVRMSGEVRAAKRADLAFRVPGQLIELPVKEGDRVRKGQRIARLDPTDYEARLRNALGMLAKAKAKLEYDKAEYQRYLRIRQAEPGAVSESMLNLKKAAMEVSRAELQSAQATVAEAREQLAYTTLKAPFPGIIGRRYVDNFEFVTAKQPIVHLQDFSRIEVLLDLPELMVAPIRKVEPRLFAEFTAAPGRRFPLEIKEFATKADPVTQTYRVVLVTPAPEGIRILPGMTATVVIELPQSEALDAGRIVIPAGALFADAEGHPCVWVVDPQAGAVHKRRVQTGRLTDTDRIEVTEGLKIGETIAVSGVAHLQEGMKVRPYQEKMDGRGERMS